MIGAPWSPLLPIILSGEYIILLPAKSKLPSLDLNQSRSRHPQTERLCFTSVSAVRICVRENYLDVSPPLFLFLSFSRPSKLSSSFPLSLSHQKSTRFFIYTCVCVVSELEIGQHSVSLHELLPPLILVGAEPPDLSALARRKDRGSLRMVHNDRDAAQHVDCIYDRVYARTSTPSSLRLCLEHGDGRTDPRFVRPVLRTSLQKETDTQP